MKNFAEYLKKERLKMAMEGNGKFTQSDMVDFLNSHGMDIARPTYGNWETNRIQANEKTIKTIKEIISSHGAK